MLFFLRPWNWDSFDAGLKRKFYLPIYESVKKEIEKNPELIETKAKELNVEAPKVTETVERIRRVQEKALEIDRRIQALSALEERLKETEMLRDLLIGLEALEQYKLRLFKEEEELILLLIQ